MTKEQQNFERREKRRQKKEALWADHPWAAMSQCFAPAKRRAEPAAPPGPPLPPTAHSLPPTEPRSARLARLEAKAFEALVWELDAGNFEARKIFWHWYRRAPDGSIVLKPLSPKRKAISPQRRRERREK